MYLLYTDETNMDPNSEFFIYGGCVIPEDTAPKLSNEIDSLRLSYGYSPLDPLKFNTRERPKQVTSEKHTEIKKKLIGLAADNGVKILLTVILHKIATSPEEARQNQINTICYHFNCFLCRKQGHGFVLIDTFTDKALPEIVREKFCIGLRNMPYSKTYRLDRILGVHVTHIGSSHFCSVIDVALGSLRFALNNAKDEHRRNTCIEILTQLSPMFYREDDGRVSSISMDYSPKKIRSPLYEEQYMELHALLGECGIDVSRKPTEPTY